MSPTGSADLDFIGVSQPVVFPAGLQNEQRSVTFTVRDDNLPEEEEIFQLKILVVNGHGTGGNPDTALVVVNANDDAYGVFSFASVSQIQYLLVSRYSLVSVFLEGF